MECKKNNHAHRSWDAGANALYEQYNGKIGSGAQT